MHSLQRSICRNLIGERAARNRDSSICRSRCAGHAPFGNIQLTTLDLQGRRIGARNVHINRAGELGVAANDGLANGTRFGIRIRPEITARQVAAQNLSLVPVLNNSLLAGQRAAVEGELAIAVVLDRNEVLLLERATVKGVAVQVERDLLVEAMVIFSVASVSSWMVLPFLAAIIAALRLVYLVLPT